MDQGYSMDQDQMVMETSDKALPIDDAGDTQSSQHDHSKTTHGQDCCKTLGHCLFGTCSFAALKETEICLLTPGSSAPHSFYKTSIPAPLISSPYRPPILV
jgi:hypothetical protein